MTVKQVISYRDVLLVPPGPISGLVTSDEQDRPALRIEGEKNPQGNEFDTRTSSGFTDVVSTLLDLLFPDTGPNRGGFEILRKSEQSGRLG